MFKPPQGGRAYALAVLGILVVGALALVYQIGLLWAVATQENVALTPELLAPITFAIIGISGIAGAQVAPNVAERWAGKNGVK